MTLDYTADILRAGRARGTFRPQLEELTVPELTLLARETSAEVKRRNFISDEAAESALNEKIWTTAERIWGRVSHIHDYQSAEAMATVAMQRADILRGGEELTADERDHLEKCVAAATEAFSEIWGGVYQPLAAHPTGDIPTLRLTVIRGHDERGNVRILSANTDILYRGQRKAPVPSGAGANPGVASDETWEQAWDVR